MSFSLIEDFLNKAPSNDKYYKIECLYKSQSVNSLEDIVILCDKNIEFKHDSVFRCPIEFFVKENTSLRLNYTNTQIPHFDMCEDEQTNFVIMKFSNNEEAINNIPLFKNQKCNFDDLQYMLDAHFTVEDTLEKCTVEITNPSKFLRFLNIEIANAISEYVHNIMNKILFHKDLIIPNIGVDNAIFRIYVLPKYKYDKFIRILRTVFEKDFV